MVSPTGPADLCILAAAFACAGTVSCGASIRALYESDVRFEHCMALDTRPDVKPTIRRACWAEWLEFYTFGQMRDRIDHARMREQQLSTASDFDEADTAQPRRSSPMAVPEPTSVFAPPPMMLVTDGGAPDASTESRSDVGTTPVAYTAECQQSLATCRKPCKTASCETLCEDHSKGCLQRCP